MGDEIFFGLYLTQADFIGNDYKRSVQIAFALGSLSKNFVVEKQLIRSLIKDDFNSIGLSNYGVEIHIDELSKKEVLSYIDDVNFNTKQYLQQDYENFKKYISCPDYPKHVDYINNDYAPDLIKFIQSRMNGRKNASYYGFLKAIAEQNIPSFDDKQEGFIKYISEMLPIVRPYEYLIVQKLLDNAGIAILTEIESYVMKNATGYRQDNFKHALKYMTATEYFSLEDDYLSLNVKLGVEMDAYLRDLLEYGLGKYDIDFSDHDQKQLFHLWKPYRKDQVQLLLLNNPNDIMKGTKIYGDTVYVYVTVIKDKSLKEELKYADGYIDENTFQWETVANVSDNELNQLKKSKCVHIFVRKVDNEDGIQLPFTYIGHGHMEYVENSRKENGAHLFRIPMSEPAPEDMFFDFKLPN